MTEKLEEIQRRSAQIAREKTALLRAVVESKRTRQPAPDVVEAAAKAIMSYLFEACQPNRGDIFSWCDDHSTEIAQAALQARPDARTHDDTLEDAWGRCELIAYSHKQMDLKVSVANSDDMTLLVTSLGKAKP